MRRNHGDEWLPAYLDGQRAPPTPSGYKEGDEVKHVVWGRTGTVASVRDLSRRAPDGSKWMLRVRWNDGGVGTDGDVKFVRVKPRPPRTPPQSEGIALLGKQREQVEAESLFVTKGRP